jgi:hypothetical protein
MKKILIILLLTPSLLFGQVKHYQPEIFTQWAKFLTYIHVGDTISCDSISVTKGSSTYWLSPYTISKLGSNIGYTAENIAHKGIANGYAGLDASGKVIQSELYPIIYSGRAPYVLSSLSAMLALDTAKIGDVCIRSDSSKSFILRVLPASNYGHWNMILSPLGGIMSINGYTGSSVTLTKTDFALNNVTNNIQVNLADSNKATSGGYETPKDVNLKISTKEPVISSGATSQFWRGDKSFHAISLTTSVIDSLPIINGGTGSTYKNGALNNLLPNQTSNSGKSLITNGTNASWQSISFNGYIPYSDTIPGNIETKHDVGLKLATKQSLLYPGINLQTINGHSLLQAGDFSAGYDSLIMESKNAFYHIDSVLLTGNKLGTVSPGDKGYWNKKLNIIDTTGGTGLGIIATKQYVVSHVSITDTSVLKHKNDTIMPIGYERNWHSRKGTKALGSRITADSINLLTNYAPLNSPSFINQITTPFIYGSSANGSNVQMNKISIGTTAKSQTAYINGKVAINKDSLKITSGKLYCLVPDTVTNEIKRQLLTSGGGSSDTTGVFKNQLGKINPFNTFKKGKFYKSTIYPTNYTDSILMYGGILNASNLRSDNFLNVAVGSGSLSSNFNGSFNAAIGVNSLCLNSNGVQNTATGQASLFHNNASLNVATGYSSLYFNSYGAQNTATGSYSLYRNSVGTDNVAAGYNSLYNNLASYNVATGSNSLYSNSNGNFNVAEGYNSLYYNNGSYNVATGSYSLYYNSSGSYNVATGSYSLYSNNASYNVATGYRSLYYNSSGNFNVAEGYNSLYYNNGSYNVATGSYSLYYNSSGSSNVATGSNSLYLNNGSNNIAIGYGCASNLQGASSNNIYIGANNLGKWTQNNILSIDNKSDTLTTFIIGDMNVDTLDINANLKLSKQNYTNADSNRVAVIYSKAKLLINSMALNKHNAQNTYTGSISGSAVWSMPFQESGYKKFFINMQALHDAGGSITFPVSFTKQPYIYGDAAAVAISSANTTTFTISTASTITGNVFVEGY